MKLDDRYNNTSCREMTTYEKMEYCNKINKVLYDKKCQIIKTEEDCQKEDEYSFGSFSRTT